MPAQDPGEAARLAAAYCDRAMFHRLPLRTRLALGRKVERAVRAAIRRCQVNPIPAPSRN